jgi:hypothetical protein
LGNEGKSITGKPIDISSACLLCLNATFAKAAAAGKVANFELQSLIAKREQVQYDLAVNALSKLAKYQLTDESLDTLGYL